MASTFAAYCSQLIHYPELGFSLDLSRAPAPAGFAERMAPAMRQALADMAALEKGAIANPDEKRMVGHYWLRAPELAPNATLTAEIKAAVQAIHAFAQKVRAGEVRGQAGKFTDLRASASAVRP